MKRVYLLYYYDEYGPEEMVATTNKGLLLNLLEGFRGQVGNDHITRSSDKLASLLAAEIDVGCYPLDFGWGGMTLKVLELVE